MKLGKVKQQIPKNLLKFADIFKSIKSTFEGYYFSKWQNVNKNNMFHRNFSMVMVILEIIVHDVLHIEECKNAFLTEHLFMTVSVFYENNQKYLVCYHFIRYCNTFAFISTN